MSNIGKIVQVIGPVVDVDFSASGKLPEIYNALEITVEVGGKSSRLVCEVQQHLGDGWVRSVAMTSTDGLKRGMDVIIAVIFHDPINTKAKTYMACLSNYYTIQGDAITRFQLALSINMHEHEIIMIKVPFKNPINMWDVHHIPEIIETGRLAIDAHKANILTAIHTFSSRA